MVIYNVDKPYIFDKLLVVDINNSVVLHGDQYEDDDIGIGFTKPEFLGRFRKCKHDGTIANSSTLTPFIVPGGSKVVIKQDCTVGIILSTGKYYEFSKVFPETFEVRDLDQDNFGPFGSYLSMSFDNFETFLNSYKVDKPKPPRSKKAKAIEPTEEDFNDMLAEVRGGKF